MKTKDNSTPPSFKPLTLNEISGMVLLYRQQLSEYTNQPIPTELPNEDYAPWQSRLSNKQTWSIGAFIKGKLVGYAISFPGPGLDGDTPQPKSRIRILTVMKSYGSGGLLADLLDRAIGIAQSEGVKVLEICLLESEKALISLVKFKGFVPNGTEREQAGQAKIHFELNLSSKDAENIAFNALALEEKVNKIAEELAISTASWQEFTGYMLRLKRHNELMYMHSLRVGIYSEGVAAVEKWEDLNLAFFGGLGHDYGKCLVSNRILNAKHYDDEKYEKVKEHSFKGYEALKDKFLFTAFIAGLHHKYQLGGKSNYGIDLEKDSPIPLDAKTTKMIETTAELVALADFFDALVTRRNDKGLVKNFGDMAEAKQVMMKYFEPWASRVEWLFANRIT